MNKAEKTGDKESFEKIIIPVDGSELSKKAAQIACSFAERINKKIVFLHVVELPATALPHGEATYVPNISDTLKKNGKSILEEVKKMCDGNEANIETEIVEGIPHQEIIKFSDEKDLIIMGSKGHSAVERILVGSVSEKVLHHSNSSVMIVR